MKKSKTVGGENIYVVKMNMIIDYFTFVKALRNYYIMKFYQKNNEDENIKDFREDFKNLTKSKARKILKESMENYGRNGEDIEIDDKEIKYNDILYEECGKFVSDNYPYLKK